MALVGGHGAVCTGGEDARHSSTGAAEYSSRLCLRAQKALTDWDGNNRDDLAVVRDSAFLTFFWLAYVCSYVNIHGALFLYL